MHEGTRFIYRDLHTKRMPYSSDSMPTLLSTFTKQSMFKSSHIGRVIYNLAQSIIKTSNQTEVSYEQISCKHA